MVVFIIAIVMICYLLFQHHYETKLLVSLRQELKQAHTSNLFGTYEGTLPAADCEGIKTILVINEDKTYTLKSEYIGREDATFETSGIYHIIGDSIMELVTPSSGEKT